MGDGAGAGVDSSTQSFKVVVRDADSGELVRSGRSSHPDGTEIDPERWWEALQEALVQAGGLDGVDAVAVAGQQHGMVCLDENGAVVRPALLWNDTRSAAAAADLVAELGAERWADPRDATGIVAGFADATGAFLPLVCTLNAARVLDAAARLLGTDLDELSRLGWRPSPARAGSSSCRTSRASVRRTYRTRPVRCTA